MAMIAQRIKESRGLRQLTILVSVLSISWILSGCSQGQRPFKIVQLCLQDDSGVSSFLSMLRSIADQEQMTFIDNSSRTQAELDQAKKVADQLSTNGRAINVGIEGSGGIGMTAGNLGLTRYQVALGFSTGDNSENAQAFAKKVVARLRGKWLVQEVPSSQGAHPMKNCP
ncbi:hypothetical protein [Sphingomonas sp. Leaf37]|uniref:hypothetical protein n=1 Tax=Sphingomonas sp. Leaf37 TaxID=2876552 RepID=UPI001E2E99F5|nr:hypothetical protein [Sphingomonas sp. Leaf37]